MNLERLQDELTELLCQLTLDQLKQVCNQAKVLTETTKRHALIQAVNESVDTAVGREDKDVAKTFVWELIATATWWRQGEATGGRKDSVDKEELQRLQKQYAKMQANFQSTVNSNTQGRNELVKGEVVISREFRINGQIGELGQKE